MINAGLNLNEDNYSRSGKSSRLGKTYIPDYVESMKDNHYPSIRQLVGDNQIDIVCENGPFQRWSGRYLIDFFGNIRIKLQYPLDMVDHHLGRYESSQRVLSPQSFNQYFDVDKEKIGGLGIIIKELKDEPFVLCGKQSLPAHFKLIRPKINAVLEIRRVKKNLNG